MTTTDQENKSISPISAQAYATVHLAPGAGTIEVEVTCRMPKPQTVMYSPLHRALVLLDECDSHDAEEATENLNTQLAELEQLEQQYQQALSESVNGFASDALADQMVSKRQQLSETLGLVNAKLSVSDHAWMELHSLDKPGHILLAPSFIVDRDGKKRIFNLIPQFEPKSAFDSLQNGDGSIDKDAFKNAFKLASTKLKAEWQLGDGTEGQLNISDVFPASIAGLLSDRPDALSALDDVIAHWNEALVWQARQFQSEQQLAIQLMQEDPFTFEAFGRVQQLCAQIWQEESPARRYRYNQLTGGQGQQRIREQLADQIKNKPLPPAIWRTGAEASLMRYATKATLTTDFKPRDGVIGLEVKGEMKIAIAQGSMVGSVYYPHDQGRPLSFSANTRETVVSWQVFGHCTPQKPCFEEGSTFIHHSGLLSLADALTHWKLTEHVLSGYQLVVFGHDDAETVPDINDALSKARSEITYALLTYKPNVWLAYFESGQWEGYERSEMNRIIQEDRRPAPATDLERISGYFDYFHQRVVHLSSAFSKRQNSQPQRLWFAERDFVLAYLKPSADIHQYLANQPDQRFDKRMSIIVLEAKEQKAERARVQLQLGHVRAKLSATLAGFAGANVALAGQLAIDVSGGVMALGRMNENAGNGNGVGAEAELFAGAKLEAGVAAELEWKAPDEESSLFEILGTAGYIVSGQAGVGLTGQFKIGYDREINRFVIKIKAALCLGLGVGGKLEVTVDAKQVWSFLRLVHEQLMRVDFNWVDLFDEEVYDYFVAWSYELINQGYWMRGTAMLSSVEVASKAVVVLNQIADIKLQFNEVNTDRRSLQQLMSFLSETKNSLQLRYAAPEVKGRILYLLIHTPSAAWIDEHITNHDAQRQNHVLNLLQVGVHSQREYLEVLEHTLGESRQGRTAQQRCQHSAEVHADLRDFIAEHHRSALAQWWEGLSDPSGCLCISSTAAPSPFN